MRREEVAKLVMRVFALYVATRGLSYLLFSSAEAFRGTTRVYTIEGVVTGLILLAAAVFLWRKAEGLGARVLGPESQGEGEETAHASAGSRLGALDVHAIAFTVVGVAFLATGIGYLGSGVGQWVEALKSSSGTDFAQYQAGNGRAEIYMGALHILVGAVMTLSARSLATWVRQVWWRGRNVVRANRFELVDFAENVRAQLVVDEQTLGHEEAALEFFDESGRKVAKLPEVRSYPVGSAD